MTVYICDWTHWQGKPLPAKGIAAEGFGMVKIKAGGASQEGPYFEDPTFLDSAVALTHTPTLIPGVFWYLVPGRVQAQAGLFCDMLSSVNLPWAAFLDVEQGGLTWRDVHGFTLAWKALTNEQPLHLYTRRGFWETLGAPVGMGAQMFPVLEEARWVPAAVRTNASRPYAGQQAKSIDPQWWMVNYGGHIRADILQFTDTALVQNVRTSASIFPGTQAQLRTLLGLA